MGVRRFKSREAYRKWVAYGHIRTKGGAVAKPRSRSVFATTPGHQAVVIAGKPHPVVHHSRPETAEERIKRIMLGK